MFSIPNLGRPVPREEQPETGGNHHGVGLRENTPLPSFEDMTSTSAPRRSRRRRKYSRRSDTASIASSASGGSPSAASVASQFAESLSSSSSSDPGSVQSQPACAVKTPSALNSVQRYWRAHNIRRSCAKLKKAKTSLEQATAASTIVQYLERDQFSTEKVFTELLQGDSKLQSKCFEVALLHWGQLVGLIPDSRFRPECLDFIRFISIFKNSVGEESVQNHLIAFFKSHSDATPSFEIIVGRVYTVFKLLQNPSTTVWCHMFAYGASNIIPVSSFFPATSGPSGALMVKFHGLIRIAPINVLQSAALDISRALESITRHFYPVHMNPTTWDQPSWARIGYPDCIALLDLMRTLGERDLWPEVTSPLRWMVKPDIGTTLIQITTNVPPCGECGEGLPPLARCLALAALQVMRSFETVKQEIVAGDQVNERFACLFATMLGKQKWGISEKDLECLVGSKKIYPHEGAYDILGCFPRSMFAAHLATAMEDACRAGKEECFKLLDPLAWLTRMEDKELNDAMLSAGVFAFFERMARLPLPEDVNGLDYLVECDKKGDALICFRNIFNILSPGQIARYTTLEMMKLILKLRDDLELPSRVTRRALDAYDAFIGDSKEKRSTRRTDEEYRRLWVRVRPSESAVPTTSHPIEPASSEGDHATPAQFPPGAGQGL
ncbi:hypothetical protein FRB99_008047 [Tulasnella sp. 403]|nr:hypothetical protein FRB99_008047 [Tulasnella sp. 403]